MVGSSHSQGCWDRTRDALGVPRRVDAHDPLGAALAAFARDGRPATIDVLRGEGFSYALDAADFFTLDGPLRALDERAIAEARGRVLDVGAGVGRHALAFAARGLDVTAIDISPSCVELMRSRGVHDARLQDVFGLSEVPEIGRFDTIVFLMQSIGIAGTLFGLESLLGRLRDSLRPGGCLLLDSSPLQGTSRSAEVTVSFEYRNLRGQPFPWLYVAESDLEEIARARGWEARILLRADAGEYLARLEPEPRAML